MTGDDHASLVQTVSGIRLDHEWGGDFVVTCHGCGERRFATLEDALAAIDKCVDTESVARYRSMTGMDLPIEERARRAREHAAKTTPLAKKTW